MAKKISLTIPERYDVIKYAHNLPSNIALYSVFPEFVDAIQLSDEEGEKYEIKVVDGVVTCNAPDLTFEYDLDTFPPIVIDSIKNYVNDIKEIMAEEKKANKNAEPSKMYVAAVKALEKLVK